MENSWILDKAELNNSDEQSSFETFVLWDFSKHILANQTVKEKGLPWQKLHLRFISGTVSDSILGLPSLHPPCLWPNVALYVWHDAHLHLILLST